MSGKFEPFSDAELCLIEDRFGRIAHTIGTRDPRKHRGETEKVQVWHAVFAAPTPAQAHRFEAAANSDNPGAKAGGLRDFANDTIVALSFGGVKVEAGGRGNEEQRSVREAWKRLREEHGYPGAHIAASPALVDLHGMSSADEGKD